MFQVHPPLRAEYTYQNSARGGAYTTNRLNTETLNSGSYQYEYDEIGNITLIKKRNSSGNYVTHVRYEYDALNRLIREDNLDLAKTIVYTYDKGNNITSKNIYNYTTGTPSGTPQTIAYSYEDSSWKDLLTSYNGQGITYDAIGNPLTYRDGMQIEWDGRDMKSLTKNNIKTTYNYDYTGLRTSKNINGEEKSSYYYIDGKLMYEVRGAREFYYSYDSFGSLCHLAYYNNGSYVGEYNVQTNSRGDVTGLYDSASGACVATYTYDSWGNVLSIKDANGNEITDQNHIANLNPIRYRGYYYDTETGFYYLKSRYYDPVTARFINADIYMGEIGETDSHNLFAYCLNNPVMFFDPTGHFSEVYGKQVAYAIALWGLASAIENGLDAITALTNAVTILKNISPF